MPSSSQPGRRPSPTPSPIHRPASSPGSSRSSRNGPTARQPARRRRRPRPDPHRRVVYWLTGTAGSSARIYYEGARTWGQAQPRSPVPTAVAVFPGDTTIRPAAERDHNLVHGPSSPRRPLRRDGSTRSPGHRRAGPLPPVPLTLGYTAGQARHRGPSGRGPRGAAAPVHPHRPGGGCYSIGRKCGRLVSGSTEPQKPGQTWWGPWLPVLGCLVRRLSGRRLAAPRRSPLSSHGS